MAFSGPLPKNKLSPSEIWTLVLHRWGWSLVTPCLGASLPVPSKDPFEKERARVEWFSECSCLIFAAVHGSEDAGLGGLLLVRSMCLVSCVVTAETRAADTAGDCAGSRVKVTSNSALQPPVNEVKGNRWLI